MDSQTKIMVEMIRNPVTGRLIRKDGAAAKRLAAQGYLDPAFNADRSTSQGFVYFLQSAVDTKLDPARPRKIKIGQTRYLPEDRRDQLELGHGSPMSVICWLPVADVVKAEKSVHGYFSSITTFRETFELSIDQLGEFSDTELGWGLCWSQ